jgi:hypothetical protein
MYIQMGTCTYRWKERLKYFEAGWFEWGGSQFNHKHWRDNDTDSGLRYPPPVWEAWVSNTASERNRMSLILRQFAPTFLSQYISICIRNCWWNSERFWPSNITRWITDVLDCIRPFGSEKDKAFWKLHLFLFSRETAGRKVHSWMWQKELFLVTGPLCPVHVQVTLQLTVRNSVHINVKNLSESLIRFYAAVIISSTFLLFWRYNVFWVLTNSTCIRSTTLQNSRWQASVVQSSRIPFSVGCISQTLADDGNGYISIKYVFLFECEAVDKVKRSNSKWYYRRALLWTSTT